MTTYNDAVAEARQLVKRSEADQWRLAELTWQAVKENGKSKYRWARDIGTRDTHVLALYRMWIRWSSTRASDRPSATEAYLLAREDTDDLAEAQQEKIDRRAASEIQRATPERRAEIARDLLAQPEIAERVVYHDRARTNIRRALDRRYEQAPKPYPSHPEPARHDHTVEVLVRLRAISTAIKNATDLILSGPQLDGTDDLLAVLDWQANALSIIRTALTGTDMDAELAKILENGS